MASTAGYEALAARLQSELDPLVADLDVSLVDVEIRSGLVRLVVDQTVGIADQTVGIADQTVGIADQTVGIADHDDCSATPSSSRSGVDVDQLSAATKLASEYLENHDPFPGESYRLEVSSPGVERPLRTPEHYRRAVGEQISVRTHAGTAASRRVEGKLIAVTEEGIRLLPSPALPESELGAEVADSSYVELKFSQVERARTVFAWGAAAGSSTLPGGNVPKAKKQHEKRVMAR